MEGVWKDMLVLSPPTRHAHTNSDCFLLDIVQTMYLCLVNFL